MILIISLPFLLLFTMTPTAYADTHEHAPGNTEYYQRYTAEWQQKRYEYVDDLHFEFHGEKYQSICGWRVTVSIFTSVTCVYEEPYLAKVRANGAVILPGSWVSIDVEVWYNAYDNSIVVDNSQWTPDGAQSAPPYHGWVMDGSGSTVDITILNVDPTRSFNFTDLGYYYSPILFGDLTSITSWTPISGEWSLGHGESESFPVTVEPSQAEYVYAHWTMRNETGSDIARVWAAHRAAPPVGGIMVPVDKLGLLAPYIGLASTILVATVAAGIYVKRVKRRKEKQ